MIGEDELLERFEKVRRYRRNEWLVTCPAHADRTPSLHVTLVPANRWLMSCQAGCETEMVLLAIGLQWTDLFADTRKGREIVAEYDYVDRKGTLLYQVVRFHPKDFRQRRPDGAGGWIWNLQGVRRVVYRFPKVLDAVRSKTPVYVVDGEKDVHTLEQHGLVATCCPGGAKKWNDHPHYGYTRYFRGATVGVIVDRDEAGHEHMKQVVSCLRRVATVRVGMPAQHKDVTEHLHAGYRLEDLEPINFTTDDAAIERLNGVGASALGRPGSRAKLLGTLESTFTSREEMEQWLVKELPHLQYVLTPEDLQRKFEQRSLWEREMSGGT